MTRPTASRDPRSTETENPTERPTTAGALRLRGPQRRLRSIFILLFLTVQLILPLRGFLQAKPKSRGNFSWNMYSQRYSCESRYVLLTPDGRGALIQPGDYSRDPDRIGQVFRKDWIAPFNAWLCSELGRQGRLGQLKARARCWHNFRPSVELLEPYQAICTIDEEGVKEI